jgi:hypothetical protein
MRRSFDVRATPPLIIATIAVAALLTLGVQPTGAPPEVRAAIPVVEVAQVEGVSTAAQPLFGTSLSSASSRSAEPPWLLRHSAEADLDVAPTATVAPTRTATTATRTTTTTIRASTATTTSTATVWWSRYHGTNHVWMPTLGLSKAVYFYGCDRTTYPANVVYRWGCGGHNNVYLFGHNYGVFYPLYQAWRSGTLRKGLPVVYADGSGRTRLYRVTTWRVVLNTDGAWAIASQPVPSMTLQTCTATSGPYRLVVRLVAATR